jgi:hypothetical protein
VNYKAKEEEESSLLNHHRITRVDCQLTWRNTTAVRTFAQGRELLALVMSGITAR